MSSTAAFRWGAEMKQEKGPETFPREAVAVFQSARQLQDAIDELLVSGFNHGDISLLADESAFALHPDLAWRSSRDLADEPGAPRAAYVSPESMGDAQGAVISGLAYLGAVATAAFTIGTTGPIGGAVVTTALAAGVGGGIGALLARLLRHGRAIELSDQLARGGLLLWVRKRGAALEQQAIAILQRHQAGDVHVHDILPESVWRGEASSP